MNKQTIVRGCRVHTNNRTKAAGGPDAERRCTNVDATALKRPIAADFHDSSFRRGQNGFGERRELLVPCAIGTQNNKWLRAVLCRKLPGLLEPLLILRRLLPALVGRAGPDQVHVST